MFIKSFARFKREKLYGALDKGKKRVPEEWDMETLMRAFYREEIEFAHAYDKFMFKDEYNKILNDDPSVSDIKQVMEEIADLSNILDFIYDKMLTEIEMIMKAHQNLEKKKRDKMFDEMNKSRVKLGLEPMKRLNDWDTRIESFEENKKNDGN